MVPDNVRRFHRCLKRSGDSFYSMPYRINDSPNLARLSRLADILSSQKVSRIPQRAQHIQYRQRSTMNWFLDWDGTMTTSDTLSIVASIGYQKNRSQSFPSWSHFAEAYMSDYRMHAARNQAEDRSGISLEQFSAWQEILSCLNVSM